MQRTAILSLTVALMLAFSCAVQAEVIDGSIFYDNFNDTSLNQWGEFLVADGGTYSASGGQLAITTPSTSAKASLYTDNALDYSESPDNWWAETSFSISGTELNRVVSFGTRSWAIFSGSTGEVAYGDGPNLLSYVSGFDLRAMDGEEEGTFDLAWYGWDNANTSRVETTLTTGLTQGQTYVIQLHRKSDDNVDIYLGDTLVSTQALIGDVNPNYVWFGDLARGQISATGVYDYVKIGVAVPEPSTLALLSVGLIGLLAYAWKKRK